MKRAGKRETGAEMWRQLVIDSLMRPREAARQILALGLPVPELVQVAVLVTCAGTVVGYLAMRLSPGRVDPLSAAVLANPLVWTLVVLSMMAATVVLTVRVGRLFGGIGDIAGALALVVWLALLRVLLLVVQLGALVVMPPLAALLTVVAVIWMLWAFANFVAELHGFRNQFAVLGGVLVTTIVVLFTVGMLLAILGITPQETS